MDYRILRIKGTGEIWDVVVINAPDDDAAMARARMICYDGTIEVWCGHRQLETLTLSLRRDVLPRDAMRRAASG